MTAERRNSGRAKDVHCQVKAFKHVSAANMANSKLEELLEEKHEKTEETIEVVSFFLVCPEAIHW